MTDSNNSSQTHDSYLETFGLKYEPFENQPQDEFFLLDSNRAQRLNMLYHLAQNSELLLLVTGVRGSGKTSLLNRFLDMDSDSWRHCCVTANAMMNPDELLIQIAEGFGLPQDSVNFGNVFDVLPKRLTEMKLSELMPVLIIDDAHELPAASLAVILKLSELSEDNERLLRIVLFSEPQISEQLNAPELTEVRHRITHTLDMPLLTEQETTDYILFRLSVAGLQGEMPFSPGQLKKIHKLANGLPGLVNIHAREILLGTDSAQSEQVAVPTPDRLRSTLLLVLILGITGAVTWYVTYDMFDSLDEGEEPEIARRIVPSPLPLLPPSKKLSETTAPIPEPPADTPAKTLEAQPAAPTMIGTNSNAINPFALTTPDPVANKAPSEPVQPPQQPAEPEIAVKADTSASDKPVAELPKQPEPTPITKPIAKSWLAQQNPTHFTLQIMGSRKRSAVALVQRAHKIGDNSAIISTKLKGADWFVLVYNSFPDKDSARAATAKLPQALRITRPWPRKIADIQALTK